MIYRVTYPLLTQDGQKFFADKDEAERFARERREIATNGRFGTPNGWRMVTVEEFK